MKEREWAGGRKKGKGGFLQPVAILFCFCASWHFPRGNIKRFLGFVEYVKTFTVPVSICKAGLPHAQMEFFTDVFRVPENLLQLEIMIVPNIGNLCNSF